MSFFQQIEKFLCYEYLDNNYYGCDVEMIKVDYQSKIIDYLDSGVCLNEERFVFVIIIDK